MSTRLGRPKRGEPTLSRSGVVEKALALAERDGVESLTMRRLGAELGVEAMALYTHVQGKDDLLAAMGSRVLAGLEVAPRERDDWRGRVEAVCRGWAALRARHPRTFELIYRADTGVTEVTEELMDALQTAGFSGADAWLAYQTLVFFLDPPLLHWPAVSPGKLWRGDRGGAVQRQLAPHSRNFSWDDVWENGLALFLDGLEARLSPLQRGARRRRAGA